MKFKIGDKVKTEYGKGEVLFIDDDTRPYLVGIKGYNGHNGHSGECFLTGEEIQKYVIDKGYDGECLWYNDSGLELIEEEK